MSHALSRAVRLARACLVPAGFVLLTAWFTFPQVVALDQVFPHQDPMFSTWRLAWVAHQLPRAPLHLLDTNILHPDLATAVYSDPALLLGLLAAPLIWLGAPPVAAYNVMLLASFVCAALGAFLLVRELTGSTAAGLFAGVAFGFSPFRFEHYNHLEIVWSCWIPLTLWALHRTIATGRLRYGVLTGLCIAAQFYSCVYLAMFLITWLVVIGLLLVLFGVLDLRGRATRALLLGAVVGALVVAPYGRAFMNSSRIVGTRSAEETLNYSARPADYLSAPPPNLLHGGRIGKPGYDERQLFPGLTVFALAIVGLWPLTRIRAIYALAILFAFDLSLGLYGFTYGPLRGAVPLFQGLRVTARAATLVHLGLAVLAGYGIARLVGNDRQAQAADRVAATAAGDGRPNGGDSSIGVGSIGGRIGGSGDDGGEGDRIVGARGDAGGRRRLRVGPWIAAAAGVLLIAELTNRPLVLTPLATRPTVLQQWLAQEHDIVMLELPMPRADRLPGEDPRYQFLSTFHWQQMVNGYSAFVPPRYFRLMEIMHAFPDRRSIGALRTRGVTHVVIHPELYQYGAPDRIGRPLIERLAVSPDFAFVGWFPDGIGTAAVFHLLPGPR